MAKMTWVLEDHLCKKCGGRILRSASGAGMTPGGNPVFRCADCGASTVAMGPEDLCWCGFAHKHNHNATAYRCVPFSVLKDRPELASAFGACGCDPKRGGEVGIMLERDLRSNASFSREPERSVGESAGSDSYGGNDD